MSEEEKQLEEKQEEGDVSETYTKEQQAIDQETANAKRARDERDEAQTSLGEAQTQITDLESKLSELVEQQEKQEQEVKLDEMVDPGIAKAIEQIKDDLKGLGKTVKGLSQKAENYERAETERVAKTEQEKRIDKVLKITEELGGFAVKYRNAALKLADDLVDSGKEKKPAGAAEAVEFMTKCYKQVTAKEKKSSTSTDSGAGGVSFSETDYKPGNLKEVRAEMEKSGRFKGAGLPKAE